MKNARDIHTLYSDRMKDSAAEHAAMLPRFMAKVAAPDENDCWNWTAAKTPKGYGHFSVGPAATRRMLSAHRVSYELLVGPIPAGLVIDHLCRNPSCVNPAHLEPVTQSVNVLRGVAPARTAERHAARADRCKHGHLWEQANTYVNPTTGKKCCRICQSRRQQEWMGRRREVG